MLKALTWISIFLNAFCVFPLLATGSAGAAVFHLILALVIYNMARDLRVL